MDGLSSRLSAYSLADESAAQDTPAGNGDPAEEGNTEEENAKDL